VAVDDALRSILVVVTGALVLTLRDHAKHAADRDELVWSGCDLDALTTTTLRAVVDHHVQE
jgi:hypothetical protein